ncbi:MAG: CcoQ/FixQ family Cbb3-type cytochrome c oxidase assembly chaperone [Cyclobacteriaceae bacterium]|nr:CcoQ/FixQ family Cbb3-type cytochrome c oxidase assembly chaperone [Cyclobacteriaceae bacterium]
MLKFITHHVDTIWGIEVFPLISFVIFFTFFVVLLIWVFTSSKQEMNQIAQLPLDESTTHPQNAN